MKVIDGFKFGIGFMLANIIITILTALIIFIFFNLATIDTSTKTNNKKANDKTLEEIFGF